MTELEIEVIGLIKNWAKKGGKKNRKLQKNRMLSFAHHAAGLGAISMKQVGERQVLHYWKTHDKFVKSTAYNCWLSLCILWDLSGKPGKPPKPKILIDKQPDAEDYTHEK